MIFFLLLQTFLSEPTLYNSAVQDLSHIEYDSIQVVADYSKLSKGEWIKTKPFRSGNNLVKIKVNNRFKLISIRIRLFKNVWKTKSYIRRSTPISPDLVVKEYMDISYLKSPIPNIPKNIIASKSLKAGSVLTAENVRNTYDCRFGEMVSLEYRVNGLRIKLSAKSLKNAYFGDVITVETDKGRVKGRLLTKGIVQHEIY
jgi:flagella basal body P-ring formation protein FlgA